MFVGIYRSTDILYPACLVEDRLPRPHGVKEVSSCYPVNEACQVGCLYEDDAQRDEHQDIELKPHEVVACRGGKDGESVLHKFVFSI